jgi:nicotinate-nucleotide adenylyltransferase
VARVALFGGSFNPPHVGHLLCAAYVIATAEVDELWVIPCFRHPFDKRLEPFDDRFEMCRRTMAPLGGSITISPVEQELGGESKTLITVKHLADRHPEHSFRLVVGSDILREREKWFGWPDIERLAPPIYVAREGYDGAETAGLPRLPSVSSTDVRARLARGEDTSTLVPRAVVEYIRTRGLYRTPEVSR